MPEKEYVGRLKDYNNNSFNCFHNMAKEFAINLNKLLKKWNSVDPQANVNKKGPYNPA